MKYYTLSGVHRSGKTTLASEISEYLSLPLVKTNVSSISKSIGFDFTKPISEKERTNIQYKIYKELLKYLPKYDCVLDRWFIDILMYTMANIEPGSINKETTELVSELHTRILDETSNKRVVPIILSPSIYITSNDDPNKEGEWFNSTLYKNQLNTIAIGIGQQVGAIIIPKDIKPNDRLEYLKTQDSFINVKERTFE